MRYPGFETAHVASLRRDLDQHLNQIKKISLHMKVLILKEVTVVKIMSIISSRT